LDRIAGLEHKVAQSVRYRLAMLEKRLRQQGIERALSVLHRNIGKRLQQMDDIEFRMRDLLRRELESRRKRGEELERRLRVFDLRPRLANDRRRMEAAVAGAVHAIRMRLAERRWELEQREGKLQQLSPLKVLERGYAIVSTPEGAILKEPLPAGSLLEIRLAKGRMPAKSL